MRNSTIWVDVTASWGHRYRRVSGITRTEMEVALELANLGDVRFVRYVHSSGRLFEVEADHLRARFAALAGAAFVVPSPQEPKPSLRQRMRLALRRGESRAAGSGRHGEVGEALLRLVRHVAGAVWAGPRLLTALARWPRRVWVDRGECASESWRPGDVFCVMGWLRPASAIVALADKVHAHEMRYVQVVHDFVPIVRPQFGTNEPAEDRELFRAIVMNADVVMHVSDNTADDLRRFCASEGLDVPELRKIPVASSLVAVEPVSPESASELHDFVLCVGTIEIRKNHHLLFDVWESFLADPPASGIPTLVVAGSLGWRNDETLARLRRTPGFERHVVFVDGPTDAKLAWLYRNCRFTVYPSFYEGWGIPISESLDAGKVCLTSNTSSMPEASEGLGVLLDPTDWRAWRAAIEALLNDDDRRIAMEDRIASEHVVTTPAQVASTIRDVLDTQRRTT